MTPESIALILFEMLMKLVPSIWVRGKLDEWEAAKAVSDAAFEAKFNQKP